MIDSLVDVLGDATGFSGRAKFNVAFREIFGAAASREEYEAIKRTMAKNGHDLMAVSKQFRHASSLKDVVTCLQQEAVEDLQQIGRNLLEKAVKGGCRISGERLAALEKGIRKKDGDDRPLNSFSQAHQNRRDRHVYDFFSRKK
jgi:hypothetical protein